MAEITGSVTKFELPKNMLVVGSTQAGKTCFVHRLLLQHAEMFTQKVSRIIYCFSVWQEKYEQLEAALGSLKQSRSDIPSKQELVELYNEIKGEIIVIFDDKINLLEDNAIGRSIVEIVCVLCHHCHISCIITLQNMFHASKVVREIGLNSQYVCLFRNNRSVRQVKTLASQTMPTQIDYFMASYDMATGVDYGYLVVDLSHNNTQSRFKLKTNIFPDQLTTVYLPKK